MEHPFPPSASSILGRTEDGAPANCGRSAAVPQSRVTDERRCNATRGSLHKSQGWGKVETGGQLSPASVDRYTGPGAVAVVDRERYDSRGVAIVRASGGDDENSWVPDGGGEGQEHDIWDLLGLETGRRSVAWPVFSTHFLVQSPCHIERGGRKGISVSSWLN